MDDDRRLRWLLRRGMKELDVMVMRYHAQRYPQAPAAERTAFVRMMETAEDPDIWAWSMGYDTTPAEYADVVEQLRIHR
ncbi:MAG: succinate dehydrogenase assembly factor 2 [Panacagrimonas sp.]